MNFPNTFEIIQLWHDARIPGHTSRYDRMLFAHKHLKTRYPKASPKQLWFAIDNAISHKHEN